MEINWLIFETYVTLLHGILQVVDTLQLLCLMSQTAEVESNNLFFSLFRKTALDTWCDFDVACNAAACFGP